MWTKGRVIERTDWNDKLFSLKIAADVAQFVAGQFIKLSLPTEDKRVARAYSLVNPPGTDYVEVLAVTVDEGALSPRLQALTIGDEVEVTTKAAGYMVLDEIPTAPAKGRALWMLATGTAVGPFLSMMDTAEPWQRFEKLVLVYGVRKVDDLAYLQALHRLRQHYAGQFELILSVTREQLDGALSCRIPEGLASGEIERVAGVTLSAEHSQVMICGNPGMIGAAQEILQQRGLTKNLRREPGQITVEKYW
jgi:ferredoxin/flavodoxin---NADP+ reductase